MKPWLFDILACPIDKHFPLKLFIFNYENKPEDFESFLNIYDKRDIEQIKKEDIIKILKKDQNLYLKDNVIIEENTLEVYLDLIISSLNELINIRDKSPYDISKKTLDIARTVIKQRIIEFSKNLNKEKVEEILPELYLINKLKIESEIESGILFCEKCYRWFPIIETIPQMLPDEYRDEQKEIEFLKTNKNLLDDEFLNQDLKPFNI
ncbi:MAG: Trm112 family protein [Promethearchaeota archaeon]